MNLRSQLPKIISGTAWLLFNTHVLLLSSVAISIIPTAQSLLAQTSSDWSDISGDPPPIGGGTRNPCDGDVVALVPIAQQSAGKYFSGYTAQPFPTVRFHVPYKPEVIKASRFFLRYRGGRIDYETSLKITAPGIIQIALPPQKMKELAIGQWYQAELQLTASCNAGKPSQSIASSVWIKRKNGSTSIDSNASPQQQIASYKKQKLWFEALDVAIKLERKKPGTSDWQDLLQSAGLKEIVGQPILDCCAPQP